VFYRRLKSPEEAPEDVESGNPRPGGHRSKRKTYANAIAPVLLRKTAATKVGTGIRAGSRTRIEITRAARRCTRHHRGAATYRISQEIALM
jgi:hypothetical protein